MTQKSLSRWMKIIIIIFAVCGVVVFGIATPFIGLMLVDSYPEYSYCYAPWLMFLLLMAIPCYSVLVIAWQVAVSISKDRAFTEKNSKRLKNVAIIALVTSLYLFAGNVVFLILNMNPIFVFAGFLLVTFIGIAISVASAVLSYLVRKAAKLQEDSDLTI